MIFNDEDKGKRTRLEDGYRTLENKKFQDYTDEDMRKLGTIDVALELYTPAYTGYRINKGPALRQPLVIVKTAHNPPIARPLYQNMFSMSQTERMICSIRPI
ncbi:hypothetical protein EGX56_01160 [Escherichia coli]|nr:hypothetical protein [Escherichia coli]EFN7689996.1 hypothetical protein [Escherichia coli]EFN7709271.1 hypothetical protein [Escherichia coli]EFN7718753.1 hypothetical protein [Escherichia coli]EFN7789707.1 hypothetical protein [Escherichia coli]